MFHRLHLRPGMPLAATAVAAVLIFAPVAAFAEDAVTVFAGADADAAPAPAAAPVAPAAAPVAPAALPAPGDPCAPAVCIDNGTVPLAVNPTGELNTRDGTGSAAGPGDAGLEYLPTGNDSTSPGCLCEGWGVGDPASGVWGVAAAAEAAAIEAPAAQLAVTGGDASATPLLLAAGVFALLAGDGPGISWTGLRCTRYIHLHVLDAEASGESGSS